jgi:O-antigen/teichoic acid export membrane protein
MQSGKSLKTQLVSAGAWTLCGKMVAGIGQLVVAALLARTLLPEEFGLFQILHRLLLIFALIGSFGMSWVVLSELSIIKQGGSTSSAVQVFIRVMILSTIVCVFLSLGVFTNFEKLLFSLFQLNLETAKWLLLPLIFLMSYQMIIPEAYRGIGDVRAASIFSGAATNLVMILFLVIFLISTSFQIYQALLALLLTSAVVITLSLSVLSRKLIKPKKINYQIESAATNAKVIKLYARKGWPLTLSSVAQFIVTQGDIWIVAFYFEVTDAAIYAAASRLVFVVSIPVMIANGATRGVIANLWFSKNTRSLSILLGCVSIGTFLAGLIPSLLFIGFGDDILKFLYGDFYSAGATILFILILGQLTLLLAGPAGTLLALSGNQSALLAMDLAAMVVFLIISLVMAPHFGPAAVAAASVFSIAAKNFAAATFVKLKLGVFSFPTKVACKKLLEVARDYAAKVLTKKL